MKKCNRDCFNCIYDDCVIGTLSSKERKEIKERDKSIMSYGSVVKARPINRRQKVSRNYFN